MGEEEREDSRSISKIILVIVKTPGVGSGKPRRTKGVLNAVLTLHSTLAPGPNTYPVTEASTVE